MRRQEGFFASLSLPFSGKTEVMWELDKVGPSTFSKADRPRPVGTPVRWERPSIAKVEQQFYFAFLD
jgi:hypothetical protein